MCVSVGVAPAAGVAPEPWPRRGAAARALGLTPSQGSSQTTARKTENRI